MKRLWNTYTRRLVLSVTAFIVVPVLFGGLARWLGGRGHFVDGFTPGVYLVTGLVLVWYTLETWQVRLAMVRQTEFAQQQIQFAQQQAEVAVTPLLVTRIEVLPEPGTNVAFPHLVVRNIGHGPGLFVQIEPLAFKHYIYGDHRAQFARVDLVEPGTAEQPSLFFEPLGAVQRVGYPSFIESIQSQGGHAQGDYEITLTYEDVQQRRFVTVMSMGQSGTKLMRYGRLG